MITRYRWWLALTLAGLAGCASPEATRVRGGGPGADLGNHDRVAELHEGAKIYYRTPRSTVKIKWSDAMPVIGARGKEQTRRGWRWPAATTPSPKPGSGCWKRL